MPALTKTSSSRPTPPWRPHNRNSPPQQGKGGNAAAAMTPACPKPTKNQSYAEPVQLSRPEYPSQSPTHHADTQISPITLKSSASKTPREKSGMDAPCAFVLSENGVVRYASRSKTLRDAGGWIPPRMEVPPETLSAGLRAGSMETAPDEVAADVWFSDWRRGGMVLEQARFLKPWDQTLTLLWFEDEEVPTLTRDTSDTKDEEPLLRELDGILPWPGKRRRR